jgi:hypothetical protein
LPTGRWSLLVKNKRNIFRSFLILTLLLAVTGCIEYRENIWLEKDGSGRLRFDVGLPEHTTIDQEEVSELGLVSLCDSVEGIRVTNSDTYLVDDITWIRVEAEFENILLLNELDNQWFGHISLEERNDTLFYIRSISMSDTLDEDSADFGRMLKYAFFGQYAWNYTLHLPDKILDSNAPLMYLDTLNNTVKWEYTMASLINEEKTMSVAYRNHSGIRGFLRSLLKR